MPERRQFLLCRTHYAYQSTSHSQSTGLGRYRFNNNWSVRCRSEPARISDIRNPCKLLCTRIETVGDPNSGNSRGNPAVLGLASRRLEALRPRFSTGLLFTTGFEFNARIPEWLDRHPSRQKPELRRWARVGYVGKADTGCVLRIPGSPAVYYCPSRPVALRPRLTTGLPLTGTEIMALLET